MRIPRIPDNQSDSRRLESGRGGEWEQLTTPPAVSPESQKSILEHGHPSDPYYEPRQSHSHRRGVQGQVHRRADTTGALLYQVFTQPVKHQANIFDGHLLQRNSQEVLSKETRCDLSTRQLRPRLKVSNVLVTVNSLPLAAVIMGRSGAAGSYVASRSLFIPRQSWLGGFQ